MDTPTEVVILCGGRGTRLYPFSVELPKPLHEIGGTPIVEHIMGIYRAQVPSARFVLAVGHLGEQFAERFGRDADVEVVDTGEESGTGERLRRARAHLQADRFHATYGDGLGDIDLPALVAAHVRSGRLATLTAVPLPSQYGTIEVTDGGAVSSFTEKPQLADHLINGGFFVFEKAALDVTGDSLEQDVLPALAEVGELGAHPHRGFWKSMDTFKDRLELEALAEGTPPWAVMAAP